MALNITPEFNCMYIFPFLLLNGPKGLYLNGLTVNLALDGARPHWTIRRTVTYGLLGFSLFIAHCLNFAISLIHYNINNDNNNFFTHFSIPYKNRSPLQHKHCVENHNKMLSLC